MMMSRLTNNSQERIKREDSAPTKSRESRKSLVHLPWRAIEEHAQDLVQNHPNQLQHSTRTDEQTLENEVGDVEVGGGGKVLTEETGGRRRVFDDGGDCGRSGRAYSCHQKHLNNLEHEISVLHTELDARKRRFPSQFRHLSQNDGQ